MLVTQRDLAKMLEYTEAGVSLAVSRKKITRTPEGFIDLKLKVNYQWMCTALAKQGREIPQEISALFDGLRPITESDKQKNLTNKTLTNKKQDEAGKADEGRLPESGAGGEDNNPPADLENDELKTLSENEQNEISNVIRKSEHDYKYWRAKEKKEGFISAQITNLEKRGELIKINPLGRFLEAIIEGSRNGILNSLTSLVTMSLNNMQNSLLDVDEDGKRKIENSQIILEETERWRKEFEKIFTNTDRDLISRIRQMKIDIKSRPENEDN